MKQEEFRQLIQDKYLFHLHTRYTDGQLDAVDYFRFAQEHGIRSIFFTEHVRKELRYDFSAFAEEIRRTAAQFPGIIGYIGAEAKLLPGGDLDISDDTFSQLEVLCFACHGFPDDIELYFESFRRLFEDPKWKAVPRVFVHPGRYLKKRDWLHPENTRRLHDLLLLAIDNGVFIENNLREMLPPTIAAIPETSQITGFDIHTHAGLEAWLNHAQ